MTEETGIKYYLDENGDYCVPKREPGGAGKKRIMALPLGELARSA